MENKPVTDLVLLPPLELIPVESLPKRCSQKLALLKQERKIALLEAAKTSPFVLSFGFLSGACAWATIIAWLQLPIVIALLASIIFAGISTMFFFSLHQFVRDVRAYRQIEVSPQLQIGAENERFLSGMAQITNPQIVIFNKRTECAPAEDIDKRFLKGLKKERLLLSANIEKIKSLAKAIERDGFESKTKEEPETE